MKLRFEIEVAAPRRAVFDFFANPANIENAYGPACRILRHDRTVEPGARTWIELTLGILQIVMGFERTLYDPPQCFAERLIHGPFSTFEHRHEFSETAGGTRIRDCIDFRVPVVYGGHLSAILVAAPVIHRAIGHRGEALTRLGPRFT